MIAVTLPSVLSFVSRVLAPALGNHLWQSTIVAAAAALLTIALRKNQAQARYFVWLVVSIKFVMPFAPLVAVGRYLRGLGRVATAPGSFSLAVQQIGQPFAGHAATAMPSAAGTLSSAAALWPILLLVTWLCGFLVVLFSWWIRWRQVTTAVRQSTAVTSGREWESLRRVKKLAGVTQPLKLLLSHSALEPGVFGIVRPLMLLPAGIADHLSDAQLDAILAHELCHLRRRDNLAAVIHMCVEALFWFHPFVWWIGARLLAERERACDEDVLRLGSEPHTYAEGILNVCKLCLESRLACVAGVTGTNLKKRIEDIMNLHTTEKMRIGKKLLLCTLGLATVAAPLVIGLINVPITQAQVQSEIGSAPKLASVRITVNDSGHAGSWSHFQPDGTFTARNANLKMLIQRAYGATLLSMPSSFDSERYDVDLKASGPASQEELRLALQKVLTDEFKLQFHIESKDEPVYVMVVGAQGPNFHAVEGIDECKVTLQGFTSTGGRLKGKNSSTKCLADTLTMLSQSENQQPTIDRPVLDNTRIKGVFDFDVAVDLTARSPFSKALEQLGLELQPSNEPIEVVAVTRGKTELH